MKLPSRARMAILAARRHFEVPRVRFADGGAPEEIPEGAMPRSPADAQRILDELKAAQVQQKAIAEANDPRQQEATAERMRAESFSPNRLASMSTPQTHSGLGLPDFNTPQQTNVEMNNAVGLARNIDNQQNRKELGQGMMHTWPVQMADDIWNAAKAPGDAYAGRLDTNSPDAIKRSFDLAGTLTFGSLPLAKPDPSRANIFAGVGSRTADLPKLETAKALEAKGAPEAQIWQETGWWKAPDGKWRNEINDAPATMKTMGRETGTTPLERVLDHPPLFAAYPDFRNFPIKFEKIDDGSLGYFHPGGEGSPSYISINSTLPFWKKRSVILHEVQHLVQELENFSRGSNIYEFQFPSETIRRWAENKYEISQAMLIKKEIEKGGSTREQAIKDVQELYDQEVSPNVLKMIDQPTQRLEKIYDDLSLALNLPKKGGFEGYRRVSGEVEARNVQDREGLARHLSREDNGEIMPVPSQTMDVPKNEQIFRYPEGGELLSSSSPSAPVATAALEAARARQLSAFGLYSHAAEQAGLIKQPKGTPQQFRAMLERAGVKKEELEGFNEAFANKPTITREEASAFFNERMPKIEETVLGVSNFEKEIREQAIRLAEADGRSSFDTLPAHVQEDYIEIATENSVGLIQSPPLSKYSSYTTPGGKNYRELLLRTPTNELLAFSNETGLNNIQEATDAFIKKYGRPPKNEISYQSSHWDDPNVLAHIRMADRQISEPAFFVQNKASGNRGQAFATREEAQAAIQSYPESLRRTLTVVEDTRPSKALHIEELQSDWAQEGRKKGFKQNLTEKERSQKTLEFAKRFSNLEDQFIRESTNGKYNSYQQLADAGDGALLMKIEDQMHNYPPYKEELQRYHQFMGTGGLPSAPYVTNTNAWTDLTLKRALKEAADGDYERMIITPGAEQAKRYDLSQSVGRVSFQENFPPPKEGPFSSGNLLVFDHNNALIDRFPIAKPEEAEAIVGREVTRKLFSQKPSFVDFDGSNYRYLNLEGQDISIGGEGMKKFYDDLVPKRLKELLKKLDPSVKVETIKIPVAQFLYDENGKFIMRSAYQHGEESLREHQRRHSNSKIVTDYSEVLSVRMTPKLREAIQRGMPAYARGGAVQPSQAQIEAGNYKKKHVRFCGLPISIENEKGSTRKGIDPNGKHWSVVMPADYGYIKRTEGADGDHVDVYIGPYSMSRKVFVINQQDKDTKKFDEHKVMLGFMSKDSALSTYRKGFSDGKADERIKSVQELSLEQFKTWLEHGSQKKPAKPEGVAKALAISLNAVNTRK